MTALRCAGGVCRHVPTHFVNVRGNGHVGMCEDCFSQTVERLTHERVNFECGQLAALEAAHRKRKAAEKRELRVNAERSRTAGQRSGMKRTRG